MNLNVCDCANLVYRMVTYNATAGFHDMLIAKYPGYRVRKNDGDLKYLKRGFSALFTMEGLRMLQSHMEANCSFIEEMIETSRVVSNWGMAEEFELYYLKQMLMFDETEKFFLRMLQARGVSFLKALLSGCTSDADVPVGLAKLMIAGQKLEKSGIRI